MAKGTKFQEKWLTYTDCNDTRVSDWATKVLEDPFLTSCIICNVKFSSAKGFEKLQQHAKTNKHKENLFKLNENQLVFVNSKSTKSTLSTLPDSKLSGSQSLKPLSVTIESAVSLRSEPQTLESNPSTSCQSENVSLFNRKESAIRAELFWCLENIKTNSSINSCNGKKEVFQAMFPGCVPESFSLSASKAQYLITEALGPYFQNLMLEELQRSEVFFTLQYDETSNIKSKKELQIRLRFWSETENLIVSQHLVTYFIGKATAQVLFKHLLKALDDNHLPLNKLLSVACDGPNVNVAVLRLFQEEWKKLEFKNLIDIGFCLIHVAHNGFLRGMDCLFLDVCDFIIKIYYFFHHRDKRCEDYNEIQIKLGLPEHKFIKHVNTRWLTVGQAAERLVEQMPSLKEYFLKYIPKYEDKTLLKQNYRDIKSYLTNESLMCCLKFVVYISKIFTTEFTLIMQREEPLIHLLYPQLKKLILILLASIVKQEILTGFSIDDAKIDDFFQTSSNFIDLIDIDIGESARESLSKLPKQEKLILQLAFKNFYIASATHLLTKIRNLKTLKDFQCLSPDKIKNQKSVRYIKNIANNLPLTNVDVEKLMCEWKLLQLDEEVRFNLDKDQRIDLFWSSIFALKTSSNTRYPEIKKVVQAALALAHGSADVERGFSKSGLLLTEDKANMSERMLNAKLAVSEGLKKYNYMVHKVPIPKDLMKLAQNAHRSYQSFLDEKKRVAEEETKQKAAEAERQTKEKLILETMQKESTTIKNMESELKVAEEKYKIAVNEAESMQKALKSAISSKKENVVVSEMMKSVEKLREKEKERRSKVDKLKKNILKRKSKVVESVIESKKQKK